MSIIDNIKEQRQQDKEEAIKAFHEAKEYTKESFNKENRNKELDIKKAIMMSPELKEFSKTQYTTHMKLLIAGIPVLLIGLLFPPLLLVAIGLIVASLVCMATNWNRINQEHKTRKQIEADVRKRLTEPVKSVKDEDYEF